MRTRSIITLIVVIALAVVVVILAVNLAGATTANQAPTPSASASASASATNSASTSAEPTDTAAPTDAIVHVESAEMTTGINADNSPTESVTQYAPEDMFIASVQIDTTDPDPVEFVWYYNGDSFDDDTVTADNGYANCELQSDHTWDPGDYMVEIYLQDSTDPDATLNFSVVAPETPTPPATASATPDASASAE